MGTLPGMSVPLQPRDDGCAVIDREADGGQLGDPCDQPPTVRAVWRFDTPGPVEVLLCDVHAADLAGHERLRLDAGERHSQRGGCT